MAEMHPSLHIDDDWKRQAQEEKKKLTEAEAAKKAQAPAAEGLTASPTGQKSAPTARGAGRRTEVPAASFAALAQTLMTQALFYLGELASRTGQNAVDLDMARMQIDLLGVLEEKTHNNLTPDEQHLLDRALYQCRMRFVSVAREYAEMGNR